MVDFTVQADPSLLLETILRVTIAYDKAQDPAERVEVPGGSGSPATLPRRDCPLSPRAHFELGAFLVAGGSRQFCRDLVCKGSTECKELQAPSKGDTPSTEDRATRQLRQVASPPVGFKSSAHDYLSSWCPLCTANVSLGGLDLEEQKLGYTAMPSPWRIQESEPKGQAVSLTTAASILGPGSAKCIR